MILFQLLTKLVVIISNVIFIHGCTNVMSILRFIAVSFSVTRLSWSFPLTITSSLITFSTSGGDHIRVSINMQIMQSVICSELGRTTDVILRNLVKISPLTLNRTYVIHCSRRYTSVASSRTKLKNLLLLKFSTSFESSVRAIAMLNSIAISWLNMSYQHLLH